MHKDQMNILGYLVRDRKEDIYVKYLMEKRIIPRHESVDLDLPGKRRGRVNV